MPKKPPLRIPRHLSNSMTYAELEKWFEAEFNRIRRRFALEQTRRRRKMNQTDKRVEDTTDE